MPSIRPTTRIHRHQGPSANPRAKNKDKTETKAQTEKSHNDPLRRCKILCPAIFNAPRARNASHCTPLHRNPQLSQKTIIYRLRYATTSMSVSYKRTNQSVTVYACAFAVLWSKRRSRTENPTRGDLTHYHSTRGLDETNRPLHQRRSLTSNHWNPWFHCPPPWPGFWLPGQPWPCWGLGCMYWFCPAIPYICRWFIPIAL